MSTYTVNRQCPVCKVEYSFEVPYDEWIAYAEGEQFIQDAMPTTPPTIREQIMTGIHAGKCWDEATKVDDEPEGCGKCIDGRLYDDCGAPECEGDCIDVGPCDCAEDE